MPTVSNGDVDIHYTDTGGDGRPVVLVHGWPLSGVAWKDQTQPLMDAGQRVIAYDRRGFGRSGKPGASSAYDYDTLTGDLDALLTTLDLRDVALVGFSMGGGEVARYLGTRGAERVRCAAFVAAIPPGLLKDEEHPDGGLDLGTIGSLQDGLRADPAGFLDEFLTGFFSAGGALKVSEDQRQEALALAHQADVHAAVECIGSWVTDFTADVASITVPTLVVHGDSDATVPFEVSGKRTHEMVAGSELVLVEDGPHGITTSHADQVNAALVDLVSR
ncbi:MAG: alpha/beta fold hydrolase [Dermatophilaceae bacterium]